jgi:transcriptional regulator with XRE-family HTH domain
MLSFRAAVLTAAPHQQSNWEMTSYKDIGQRLGRSREALGLNQRQMAEIADVSEANWSDFESSKRRISLNAAIRLSEDFGLSLDWIYFGRPDFSPHCLSKKLARE